MNFQKNDKVIVRSNEDEPYEVGIFDHYESFDKGLIIPVVNINGEKFWVGGIVKLYSKELADSLDELTPREQWNLLSINYKREIKY